jgi:2-polyprenyl-6-methoxyphenol hydroxylase-like FAD-dependent oxidoreductase
MPQWDFLDFLARKAKAYPNFRLLMETEAKDLLAKGDRVAGVLAKGPNGNIQIRAGLTIAADGRHSTLRAQSGLKLRELGAPFDVVWFSLPHHAGDPTELIGRLQDGAFLVMVYRGTYWQCAYGIPKGGFERLRAEGTAAFRTRLKEIAGFAAGRVDEAIRSFEQVKLLTVQVNRLERWARPGLLCIGDAAHAMSPAGGVGINLAIQDAVATANILAPVLRRGVPKLTDLEKVQKRRDFPTRVTQAIQLRAQAQMLAPTLRQTGQAVKPPLFVRLFDRHPILQRIPAHILGLGVRPERVK